MRITFVESKIGGVVLRDDAARDFGPLSVLSILPIVFLIEDVESLCYAIKQVKDALEPGVRLAGRFPEHLRSLDVLQSFYHFSALHGSVLLLPDDDCPYNITNLAVNLVIVHFDHLFAGVA